MNKNDIVGAFSNKQNLGLLWDVLLDELNIKGNVKNASNATYISGVQAVFQSNIAPFISKINKNASLMESNKIFLKQVLTAVNRLFPNVKQQTTRINIGDEDVNNPYKVEDIHSARQISFEKQVKEKQEDFESFASLKKPKELDFSEKVNENRITEMQTLIAETIAKRNFEIEQYQPATDADSAESWLQPVKTSVKDINIQNNKNNNNNNNSNSNSNNERKLKYMDAESNTTSLKKVSWNDNNQNQNISLDIDELKPSNANTINATNANIFNKLKKINNISELELKKETEYTVEINKLTNQIEMLNHKLDTLVDKITMLIDDKMQKKETEKETENN